MPAIAIHDDAITFGKSRIGGKALFDCAQDSLFLFLAIRIQFVELGGNFARAHLVLHREKVDDIARDVHAPGCVDARRDTESNFARSRRTVS